MGITALISGLFGLLSGFLPRVMTYMEGRASHTREMEFLRLQHDLQMQRMKAEAGAKLQEAESLATVEEIRATREHVVAAINAGNKSSGVPWIDGLNGLIRPLLTIVVMIVFLLLALVAMTLALGALKTGNFGAVREFIDSLSNSFVVFAIEGVFGYWLGMRPAAKASKAAF